MPTHNREDETLDRLLGYRDVGFYIDVGANDPLTTSNTHHLYERGWRGIDIEPMPHFAEKCRSVHPENIVFEGVASSKNGTAKLFCFRQHENSTTSAAMASDLVLAGKTLSIELEVQSTSLNSLLSQNINFGPFVKNKLTIDFLSIDTEGSENDVFAGFDVSRWKPTIICVEATSPTDLSLRTDGEISARLAANNYDLVHFDGCNSWFRRKPLISETAN